MTAIFQVAFADNAAKLLLMGLAGIAFASAPGQTPWQVNLIAALLVLPFIIFAPVAGWVADRFSKRSVIEFTLYWQIAAILVLVLGLSQAWFGLAACGFALLTAQSAFFSPAKQGILKEIVPLDAIGRASGLMELLTIAAILSGSFVGGWLLDTLAGMTRQNWWLSGTLGMGLIFLTAVFVLWSFRAVEPTQPQSKEPFRWSTALEHPWQLIDLWKEKTCRHAALGMMYFYSLGGFLYLVILQAAREVQGAAGSSTLAGLLMVCLGVGIILGSAMTGRLYKESNAFGLASLGALGVALTLGLLTVTEIRHPSFYFILTLLGAFGGMLVVPMQAALITFAPDASRARLIAGSNLLTNCGGLLAVGIHFFLHHYGHFSSGEMFLTGTVVAILAFVVILRLTPRSTLHVLVSLLSRLFYRVRVKGTEHVPTHGGALLLPNHLTYVDIVLLAVFCPRKLRIMGFAGFQKHPWMKHVFRFFDVIPVSSTQARSALQAATEALQAGEVVCIFPEGQLSRTGSLLTLNRGYEILARRSGVPLLPVGIDGLWGSIFSFERDRYFRKSPRALPYPVQIVFGPPLEKDRAGVSDVRRAILDAQCAAFSERPGLRSHLAYEAVKSLRRDLSRIVVHDDDWPGGKLDALTLLTGSLCLSRVFRERIPDHAVGVVLPSSAAAWMANLGLQMAGKMPVNLNFSLGRETQEKCLALTGLRTVLTAQALRERLKDFPWPDEILYIEDLLDGLTGAEKTKTGALAKWLPSPFLARLFQIPTRGDRQPATLLFSSGSTSQPKAIPLSHRNILANLGQLSSVRLFQEGDVLLGSLPLFHSFGFTGTFWLPLLQGLRVCTVPSPLDARRLLQTIETHRATILVSTPTFLRPLLNRAKPESLASLRFVVAGAEKTPAGFADQWKSKFGSDLLEGYGLTETSPVTAVNLPHPPKPAPKYDDQSGFRAGSVGRLLPGMNARIVDLHTGQEVSLFQTGILQLRGANVIDSYWNNPEATAKAFVDGWYHTGDLARFDEDGFLYIEGRLSRFSKIGGEMVSHGYVEEKLLELLALKHATEPVLAVTGVPDAQKGEALAVVSTTTLEPEQVRAVLAAAGVSNLWIPRHFRLCERLPTLASGKLDLMGIRRLAEEGLETPAMKN